MEKNDCTHGCHSPHRRVLWGFVLLVSGLLLLGFNTGVLPEVYKPIVFSFPSALLLVGFMILIASRHWVFPAILVGLGLYLHAPKLGLIHPEYSHWISPLILMVIGLMIIFRRHRRVHRWCDENCSPAVNIRPAPVGEKVASGMINENRVFSGTRRKFRDQDFHGGEINCVFGGCELDLSEARLPEGITRLDVNCVFGGVTLMVPDSWTIQIQVNSVFGDFQDRRRVSSDRRDENRVLVITGSCVFGGGDIKYSIT